MRRSALQAKTAREWRYSESLEELFECARPELDRTCENRPPILTGADITMDRMRFTNVSEVLWQGHDRCHPAPRQQPCPSSDGGARLRSAGSSDAPTADA